MLVLEIGAMYLYYLTPLYMLAEHVGWLHPFVHVHMFLARCLLSWFLIGRDPLPTRPHTRTRLLVLFAAARCHDLMAKLMYAHLLPRGAGAPGSVELGAQFMFYGGDIVYLLLATRCFWTGTAAAHARSLGRNGAAPRPGVRAAMRVPEHDVEDRRTSS